MESRLERRMLPVSMIENPDLVMPAHLVGDFIRENGSREGITEIAFRGAQRETFSTLEPEIQHFLHQGETLKQLLDRYFHVARGYVTYRNLFMIENADTVCLVFHTKNSVQKGDWIQVSDWSQVMVMMGIINHVLGMNVQPSRITFQSNLEIGELAREHFPNTEFKTGHWTTSVCIHRHFLGTRLPDFHLPRATKSMELVECESFVPTMKQLLAPYLDVPGFNIRIAAEISGLSVRSFQRRLSNLGLSYSELIEQTRFQVAAEMLGDPTCQVIDAALSTGYRDPSNFTRMFRRVAGISPREFQRTHTVAAL